MDSEGAPLRPDLMQNHRRRECAGFGTQPPTHPLDFIAANPIVLPPPSLPGLQLGTGRPACWASSWWLSASCWSLCL